jgi:ATP-dependent DNA helicase RecQ
VVFHDTTLRELARQKPATPGALRHIYGMGAKKAEDYGEVIIAAIAAHASGR